MSAVMKKMTTLSLVLLSVFAFTGCSSGEFVGYYDYTMQFEDDGEMQESSGVLKLESSLSGYSGSLKSFDMGSVELEKLEISGNQLTAEFERWDSQWYLKGTFNGDEFSGSVSFEDNNFSFSAKKQSDEPVVIDRSHITYLLPEESLPQTEKNIDHTALIENMDRAAFRRGGRIYNSNCINCHGLPDVEGSLPLSLKFWEQPFKAGSDPYSMYQTVTRGFGQMIPQPTLTPKEKYDVITYIRERFVKRTNKEQYFKVSPGYLAELPEGSSQGPEPKPYHPWSDQDYGNFFFNTYELVDEETGPERFHSPGPVPYADEDYTKNNFAYKGIAIRLDPGPGGVSDGNTWMMFDHDVMRVAGGWTGEGFIDWNAILLNDRHETYPRTIGKLHFETPVGPGWANPENGSFDDPRFTARDGRQFGPLPKEWSNYKGLYHSGDNIVLSYSVGNADILEQLGMEKSDDFTVFTRTLDITPSTSILKMRVAPVKNQVLLTGEGANIIQENGYHIMVVEQNRNIRLKVFIADGAVEDMQDIVNGSSAPESLLKYTKGGPAHYPQELTSTILTGNEKGLFAVDMLTPPFDNPWQCRMRLSGLDFMEDPNKVVMCTTDGDVFLVSGLTDGGTTLTWKRIGAGLFQPLGIKVVDEQIYVTCRDQLVRLNDFNGDDETDFYESFNHDHQVTDHFHEFAMGLQTDEKGNFYYAKSGRHAREALIPQHGTLLKVSKDGSKTDIIATGFRAANGVCINPDGSFVVTDQEGYWNPMNRINWVEYDGSAKFYGNMWGYNPPEDSTRAGMEKPMIWVDMEFDRSPAELLWVNSKKWGPLNGSLLSTSYGYGKIQLVLHEQVKGQKQGGVIDLPGIKGYTGIMRGRFNPQDEHLYICGMSAWSTSQNMRTGDFYRIRYTGKNMSLPVKLNAQKTGMKLTFARKLDKNSASNIANYEVKTWDLKRTRNYGSDRYNITTLDVSDVKISEADKAVKLIIKDIKPVDVMTITYNIEDHDGNSMQGTVQNTIHVLGN